MSIPKKVTSESTCCKLVLPHTKTDISVPLWGAILRVPHLAILNAKGVWSLSLDNHLGGGGGMDAGESTTKTTLARKGQNQDQTPSLSVPKPMSFPLLYRVSEQMG